MADTPNLGLPYIMAAQAQKHVTHNEAIRALDALVHLAVIDRDRTTPPASPADGDRHIIGTGSTGAWSGHDLEVAAFQDGGWAYFAPRPGWRAWIVQESALRTWNGTAWVLIGGGGDSGDAIFDSVGINATADETNRLALSSPAALFNHAGAGHQIKVNKADDADTASFLFQTDYSGRAEMGTTGDDDFHFKVSPDGSAWHEAILIDKDTGEVSFPSGVEIENPDLPSGGTTGQVLAKASNDDGDVAWSTPAGGGDMLASLYDPQGIDGDAFDRINHTGEQAVGTITGLQAALDAKAASSHTHDDRYYTESEIDVALDGKSDSGHSHALIDVTGLQAALDAKSGTGHAHIFADIASKPTTLSGYGITDAASSTQGALAESAIQQGDEAELDMLGINATADETNRFALSSPASLFNHAGAGHQIKVNKADDADTASFLFQTDYSGRAEMGTTGDDDFHFKVSPDGSAWHEAILIDKDTGEVSFPSGVDIENPGLPSGGTTGQVLAKASNDDGDVAWSTPAGGGDMLANLYDPQGIEGDAFDRTNHTGEQSLSTITGLQAALDEKAALEPGINTQDGTSYTLTFADRGRLIVMSNGTANTLTIPTNASVAFPVGTIISVVQHGAGATTIAGATGVSVNGVLGSAGNIGSRYQAVALLKIATDAWLLSGDVADAAITNAARTLLAQTTQTLMRTVGLGFSADGSSLVAAADYAAIRSLLAIAQGDVAGLTTASSPQFAALNIGHASDTTLGRTTAGILNVEGHDLALQEPGINAQTTTSYTLSLPDKGRIVTMNHTGANTLTIPANSAAAFPFGTIINIMQIGSGVTSIAGATGVTVNGISGGAGEIAARWQGVALLKIATNSWVASGALGDVA
jgi:hypothetical protein